MRQEGEPSVEEILESIKRVIARDNRELAQAERQRRESEGLITTSEVIFRPPAIEPENPQVETAPSEAAADDTHEDILDLGTTTEEWAMEGTATEDSAEHDPGVDNTGEGLDTRHDGDAGDDRDNANLGNAGLDDDDLDDEDFDDPEEDALTNAGAADAMRQSLAALAMLSQPPAAPQIVRSGETSLEGLVREMLRPMLAQWLDTNLPPIVERLVKAEISRIAGKKR